MLAATWVLSTDAPNVAVEIDAAEAERRQCIAHQIKCPVLAMCHNRGFLNPDENGRCSTADPGVVLGEGGSIDRKHQFSLTPTTYLYFTRFLASQPIWDLVPRR